MKKILLFLFALAALASCSKEQPMPMPDAPGAISPTASVLVTTETRAAVEGTRFPASTVNVFRLTAYAGTSVPTDWSATPHLHNIRVDSKADQSLELSPVHYYPKNGDKLYFYAYAPEATSVTPGTTTQAPVASYTLTGQEDIMAAQQTAGIGVTPTGVQEQPALAFTHKLMQLRFKLVKGVSFETGRKVTELLVKGVRNSAKLDIAGGTLTFEGADNNTFALPIVTGTYDEITDGGTTMDGSVMSEPVGNSGTVVLKVTTDDGTVYDDVEVILVGTNNGEAGTSHLITLTFYDGSIRAMATVEEWRNGGQQEENVDGTTPVIPKIGELKNGGVVFWVDGANYKVVSLEQWQSVMWAANTSYSIGPGAQSETDGKANTAAIKAYYEANKGGLVTESTFEAAFPPAATCYNYTGKNGTDPVGTWYLPARYEVQHLCCAVNGVPPTTWEGSMPNGFSGNATARAAFDNYLTIAGGMSTTRGYIWSSSELKTFSSNAWATDLTDCYQVDASKNFESTSFHLRCIKSN